MSSNTVKGALKQKLNCPPTFLNSLPVFSKLKPDGSIQCHCMNKLYTINLARLSITHTVALAAPGLKCPHNSPVQAAAAVETLLQWADERACSSMVCSLFHTLCTEYLQYSKDTSFGSCSYSHK